MDEWQAGGGTLAALLTGVLVYLRRRRKGGRFRFRVYTSYRSPPGSTPSASEPPESE